MAATLAPLPLPFRMAPKRERNPRLSPATNFRLLRKGAGVWKIVDDRIRAKTPAVGGVSLSSPDFPPSGPVAPYNANPWRYRLPARVAKPYKLNQRHYQSDDPYGPALNLVDRHYGGGKGQPGWLQPYRCWEPFGRIPVESAEYEMDTWLNPLDNYRPRGRKPLYEGKRALDSAPLSMAAGTWHVTNYAKWPTRQTACSVCWAVIPEDLRRYCSDECAEEGDRLRRRRRDAVKSGRWPEPRYEKRRWRLTAGEVADLRPLHIDVRRIGSLPNCYPSGSVKPSISTLSMRAQQNGGISSRQFGRYTLAR
jgi:hypothetical protein